MIDESSSNSVLNAISINSIFPHKLAEAAELRGIKVIQIATDCVYSGSKGQYDEDSPHDALDVYGKTKSLGEVRMENVYNLRCSIIGPERGSSKSLLEWVLHQPQDAVINGYTNHLWNGVTTHAFTKICHAIITTRCITHGVQHVVPDGIVTKHDLVSIISKAYNREDLDIHPMRAPYSADRTLLSVNKYSSDYLWLCAGYKGVPTVEYMIKEMERYTRVS
jgi:dTDP-4-dehydrorhamnose reductase